jgi:ligand-binding SRPBCC domain-containing protein
MPIYTLRRTQTVRMPLAECWEFFSNPANLARITPPRLGFRVHTQLPSEIYPGLMIRYTVSPLFGIPMTWLTEITQVRKPHFFVDEQRVGPYRLWHHEHTFAAVSDHETEITDLVHYVPPLGPIGALLNALVIRRQLAAIFDFRARQLGENRGAAALDSFA